MEKKMEPITSVELEETPGHNGTLHSIDKPRLFTSAEMKQITGDFVDDNFLGYTQFEKLYRGNININMTTGDLQSQTDDDNYTMEVIVKVWSFKRKCYRTGIDLLERINDEINFLQDPTIADHPNLVSVIGYCIEDGKEKGIVYDLNPVDTLQNLIFQETFDWTQRMKVALGLAKLLEFLHSKDYIVRNLAPAHIMIDKDFNPRLIDFIMITGGMMGDRTKQEGGYLFLVAGYKPPDFHLGVGWSSKFDVYLYGVILLSLIAKSAYDGSCPDEHFVDDWALKEYGQGVRSLVHGSFQKELEDDIGLKITELAMSCLNENIGNRPTMNEVVECLLGIMS